MMHLITGGSASGKSAYGESVAVEWKTGFRYYVAAMKPWGKEGKERVKKHRSMRVGKGFETIECYTDLKRAAEYFGPEKSEDRLIMVECMSNVMANEQFDIGGSDEEILDRTESAINYLKSQAGMLIVITNEVFSDGVMYDSDTTRYLRLLGEINQRLAKMADRVTEVVYGIPVEWKI